MEDLASAYEHQLGIKAKRLTPQRKLILRLLAGECDHMGACELYERGRQLDSNLSLSTVYRTLRMFKEAGLVRELHLEGDHHLYELDRRDQHSHLVCRECGCIVEIDSEPFAAAAHAAALVHGFEITSTLVEMVGCCAGCRRQ